MEKKQERTVSKRKKWRRRVVVTIVTALLLVWICNPMLQVTEYECESEEVTEDIRVALITDLHSCYYGKNQNRLLRQVHEATPDLVLLCGDIFDDRLSHERALTLVEELAKQYPCYYVSGNHEYWSGEIEEIKKMVRDAGAIVLEGTADSVVVRGQLVSVCGIDDPTDIGKHAMLNMLEKAALACAPDSYKILMAHRPEYIEEYLNYDFDLIVSGHAHGGQWRIPGILDGLYAPDQGLFPKYTAGCQVYEDTAFVISRGLSRENLPIPRIFNRPELVIITIR